MNQIETLKWIAENGNPIGTDVESSYNQYKTDPKFKKIAISLAESESGYAGIPDSIKTEYQSYKSEINKSIADSLRAKAKSDYENETQSTYFGDVVKLAAPRNYEAEGAVQKGIASLLDLGSFPGRTVAGLTAGLAKGLATKDWEEGLQTASDIMGRKSSPEGSGVLGLVEDVVKDPLLPIAATAIPGAIAKGVGGIGKVGELVASHPKTAAGLAAGLGNLALGGTERWVDPTRDVYEPETMAVEGTLGFGLGAAGRGISNFFADLGSTEAGRALLKKITPTELKAGLDERLAKLIEQGYGKKIVDEKGNIDAKKLGNFLSEQSNQTPGSKIERIPDWISSERKKVGKQWGAVTDTYSKPVDAIIGQLESGRSIVGHTTNINELIDNIIKNKIKNKQIFSEEEALKLKSDLLSLLPKTRNEVFDESSGKLIRESDPNITPTQIKDINQYLYNEGKELSPKYHKTREEIASQLRSSLQDRQERIVGEDNIKLAKQYAALSDLENLASKSNYFNPDRPLTFGQGIKSDVSKFGAEKAAPLATEALQAMTRRSSRKEGETPSFNGSRESNQPEVYSAAVDSLYSSGKMSDSDMRVAQRAVDSLKFNPNDPRAKAILDSLIRR